MSEKLPQARLTSQAAFWKSGLYSDLRLQLLCTAPQTTDDQLHHSSSSHTTPGLGSGHVCAREVEISQPSRAKVPRLNSGATAPESASAAAAAPTSHTYHLHAVTLASASGHFRSLMPLCGGGDGGSGGGGGGGDRSSPGTPGRSAVPLQLVEHVEACELDAMEAVLRHAYTGLLCDSGGAAADLSVATLVQMMVLANRFDFPICLAHSCDELAKRPEESFDIPSINTLLADVTTAWRSLDTFKDVLGHATGRLVSRFSRNLEWVCGEALGQQRIKRGRGVSGELLQLSVPSLLYVLQHSCMEAISDNTVLSLVDAWMGGEAGAGCTRGERREVVECIALGRLSHLVVRDVLPSLPWLGLSADEHQSLVRFSAAAGGAKADPELDPWGLSDAQAQLLDGGALAGPDAWYRESGIAGWSSGTGPELVWVMYTEQLRRGLQEFGKAGGTPGAAVMSGDWQFYAGFLVRLTLHVSVDGAGEEKGGRAWVGLEATAAVAGGESMLFSGLTLAGECGVREWQGPEAVDTNVAFEKSFGSGSCELLRLDRVPSARLMDVDAWAPYVVKGTLSLRCILSDSV